MIIGITGSLGTGKTTVAKMFGAKGAKVLDADKISHMVLKKGSPAYKRVVACFGRAILNKSGSVNKKKLAKIVFTDKKKLKKLTRIIHPFVIKKIKNSIKQMDSRYIVAIDAPLLIEAGIAGIVDELVVVKTSRKKQLSRCMKKRNFRKEEVISRIKNQLPLKKKIKMADYVIDNNRSLKNTRKQVNKIWREAKWI